MIGPAAIGRFWKPAELQPVLHPGGSPVDGASQAARHVSGAIRCKDAEDLEHLEDSEDRRLNNLRVFNACSGFESLSLRHVVDHKQPLFQSERRRPRRESRPERDECRRCSTQRLIANPQHLAKSCYKGGAFRSVQFRQILKPPTDGRQRFGAGQVQQRPLGLAAFDGHQEAAVIRRHAADNGANQVVARLQEFPQLSEEIIKAVG